MIHVITAVHNRYSITEAFVQSLLKQTYEPIHLILVDDGSTDGTTDMVRKLMPDATTLAGNGNLWWGGALHKAYLWVCDNLNDSDYVWIANDDTHFPDDYCEKAVAILQSRDQVLLTGYGVSKQTGQQVDGAVNFVFPEVAAYLVEEENACGNCASTRSLFLRAKDFKHIGGFHPFLLPHYGSDYEWTIRGCRKAGLHVYCAISLKYEVNEETTGYYMPQKQSVRKLFSKRSMSNPFYKILFALMAAPWGMKFQSFLCQGKRLLNNAFSTK
jgi:GT2 family glycosyltransferase